VAFRVIEFIMQVLAELSPMALLTVSQAVDSGGGSFEAVVALLLANRLWAFRMISVFLASGAFILYPVLYNTRLVPRFISIWGLIGAAGVLVTAVLEMFGVTPPSFGILMLLNELFVGGWLIAKGFSGHTEPQAYVPMRSATST
jgi:hypothetical protein